VLVSATGERGPRLRKNVRSPAHDQGEKVPKGTKTKRPQKFHDRRKGVRRAARRGKKRPSICLGNRRGEAEKRRGSASYKLSLSPTKKETSPLIPLKRTGQGAEVFDRRRENDVKAKKAKKAPGRRRRRENHEFLRVHKAAVFAGREGTKGEEKARSRGQKWRCSPAEKKKKKRLTRHSAGWKKAKENRQRCSQKKTAEWNSGEKTALMAAMTL